MSNLVDPTQIEQIVGAKRHATDHIARAVSEEETVYILHSEACLASGIDLRQCPYSRALDRAIEIDADFSVTWGKTVDRPVVAGISPYFGDIIPGEHRA